VTQTHSRKSWAGCNPVAQLLGRVCGLDYSPSAFMLSEDDYLLANLSAQAWREDPTPLSKYLKGRDE